METPHPQLLPLLEQYQIDWGTFSKKGRPDVGVREKRVAIVTALHEAGCTWAALMEITGLSNGAIQRLTQAKGCKAAQQRRQESGRTAGAATRGRRREWLTRQLSQQWAEGKFDFHRGRVRSEAERDTLRKSWTPALREVQAQNAKEHVWGNPIVCESLLAFHRSPAERGRRSRLQTQRMQDDPEKYLRGRAAWVNTPKGTKSQIYARSSYEVAAVTRLEKDPQVVQYEHERRFELPDGRWVLPDFLVTLQDGSCLLVEVKSSWVFILPPSHKVHQRLQIAAALAAEHGWTFAVWTEKELSHALATAA